MSNIGFSLIGQGRLPVPFNNLSEESHYIFHVQGNEIVIDNKTHIYANEVSGFERKITIYSLIDQSLPYPKKIYVIFNEDLEKNHVLKEFLYDNFYSDDHDDFEYKDCENSYNTFVKKMKTMNNVTLINYIKILFHHIGFPEDIMMYVQKYIDIFHVAVTANDMKSSGMENYELLESYGDHASWKPMTEIFLKYMEDNNLEMKESIITSLHRSYVSKVVQAKICKDINLHAHIITKSEITSSMREDVLEAFTGALFYTDNIIKNYTGKYFCLGEKFLKWCFSSIDFSNFEEKPEITQFHEYMKILIGPYNFSQKINNGRIFMIFDNNSVTNKLQKALPDIKPEVISEFLRLVKVPYESESDDMIEKRRKKFLEINEFILKKFRDEAKFVSMKNDLSMKDWDEETKNKFKELITGKNYTVDKRYFDKSKLNYYWVVQSEDKKDVYSTMAYSNSENPDVLVSLITDSDVDKTGFSEVKKIPYIGSGNYYFEDNRKYTLIGDKKDIEEFLKNNLLHRKNKYFMILDSEEEIEYSPYHDISFQDNFNIEYVRKKLTVTNATRYPKAIYKYIGDRMSYGQLSLIAMKKFGISDDNNMSIIKNFFRSKNLKDELTRLIDIRDSEGLLIHYDELLGMNYEVAPLVIEYIHSKMKFSNDITKNPVDVLNKLVKYICKEKRKIPGSINLIDNKYEYKDTTGKVFSVKLEGHNYNQVKQHFAKFLVAIEKQNNPNWNDLVNNYFSTFLKYRDLECFLVRKGVTEWEIDNDRNEKVLVVSFRHSGKPYSFKSYSYQDFTPVVKQITDIFGI